MVASSPPEASSRPLGLKATLMTFAKECPRSVAVSFPVCASQSFTIESKLAERQTCAVGTERDAPDRSYVSF